MNEADADVLYKAVGDRIRAARESQPQKLSQAALANKLEVSRASIVNIEAGRQHAPLFLLWQIAHQLDTELAALIPRKAELVAASPKAKLNEQMLKQIKEKAAGDEGLEQDLTSFIAQAVLQLTNSANTPDRPKRKS
ncbi:MAG: helix-turn-helix domain-containing protein [Burkholderiales bacterium]|nr:helix-turn-helix domain-containing protein [Burkholderiales bacterium]